MPGYQTDMPGFAGVLSAPEIIAVLDYIKSRPAHEASGETVRVAVRSAFQVIQDRAVRPVITLAGVDKHAQRPAHFLQHQDFRIQFRDMTFGQSLHVGTRALKLSRSAAQPR